MPAATEVALIQDYHERYGHMGSLKVIKALSEHCYMKAINKRVREIVKTCNIFQLVKVNNEKRTGTMITIDVYKRQLHWYSFGFWRKIGIPRFRQK